MLQEKVQENYFQKLIDFGPKRHSRETLKIRIFKNHRVSLYTHTSYTILYIVGWVIFNLFSKIEMLQEKVQENYF